MALIGAGSSYTPELFERLAQKQEECPVSHVTLMDINPKRLDAVAGFCGRYVKKLGLNIQLESTTDLDKAVYGADFVNAQIRVAGNEGRATDERILLDMGLIGQETTGAGGFMKALRTIPVMLKIADSMKRNAPDSWMINYSNPTGIISQAIHDNTKIKCAALCAGGLFPQTHTAEVYKVRKQDVQYDMFGLNHLTFAYNFRVKGRKLNQTEVKKMLLEMEDPDDPSNILFASMGAMASGYLNYYYFTRKMMQWLTGKPQTRGQEVLALEEDIFADYRNPAFDDKPPTLEKRGGGGYANMAIDVMAALWNNTNLWSVVNVPNQGVFPHMPHNAVMEMAALVNGNGITPLAATPPPKAVWGLVSMVKNYEMLAAEAAVTGCRETALLALVSHPLVRDYDVAQEALAALLEANKAYLPAFFGR